jgi:hypothetical protein
VIGQECSVDKKKWRISMWKFLEHRLFERPEKYGRHLKSTGCEDVKCFMTLYILE